MNVVLTLNAWAQAAPWQQWAAIFFASYTIWILAAFTAWALVLRSRQRIMACLIAIAVSYTLNWLVGYFYFMARPFATNPAVTKLITKSALSKSFPSDHATIAFVLATFITLVFPRWGWLAFLLAALVGLGRILVGVHYPSDVIVGALLGVVVALIVTRLS